LIDGRQHVLLFFLEHSLNTILNSPRQMALFLRDHPPVLRALFRGQADNLPLVLPAVRGRHLFRTLHLTGIDLHQSTS
jgi:hypothetical protein